MVNLGICTRVTMVVSVCMCTSSCLSVPYLADSIQKKCTLSDACCFSSNYEVMFPDCKIAEACTQTKTMTIAIHYPNNAHLSKQIIKNPEK